LAGYTLISIPPHLLLPLFDGPVVTYRTTNASTSNKIDLLPTVEELHAGDDVALTKALEAARQSISID
jgi:hypothetical protein